MIGAPPKEIKTANDLNRLFLDAIKEVLMDGTIIVPTYSYTFGSSTGAEPAIFDLETTKSEIGSFPNFILSQDDFIRSEDPFVSVACKGEKCKELIGGISNSSYGENSFFARMVRSNGMKCCSIGLGPNWTPFIHHADWLVNAPHRYDKVFSGYIRKGKILRYTDWVYSVPFLGPNSYATAHKVGREAEKFGVWKYKELGRARIYTSNCIDYFNFIMDKLKHDKWILAKGPEVDVEKVEALRIKDPGDKEINFSCKVTKHKTGEWIGRWLVPERWVCHKAQLMDLSGNILTDEPYLYSLSVNKKVSVKVLKKHLSKISKNVYCNRDWGFVYNGSLNDKEYKVVIDSSFGFGIIKVVEKDNSMFALLSNNMIRIDDKV
jgi:aminoglycoside N3'-acetyltransferase